MADKRFYYFVCRELADSGEEMAAVVESLLTVSLEGKGTSWELLSQLLTSARYVLRHELGSSA